MDELGGIFRKKNSNMSEREKMEEEWLIIRINTIDDLKFLDNFFSSVDGMNFHPYIDYDLTKETMEKVIEVMSNYKYPEKKEYKLLLNIKKLFQRLLKIGELVSRSWNPDYICYIEE